LLQLILLHPLGFSIASGLLFACTAAAFGKRNFVLTVPVGIVFAFVVYGVFDQILKLNLPAGVPETLIFAG
jgi:putative tricarboxylic transport membrane protein